MEFLKKSDDPGIVQKQFEAYQVYLESIRERLPHETSCFVTALWYYDTRHSQCPHDSWVEFLTISEMVEQDDIQARHVNIHVKLLGAYHDGYIDFFYKKVRHYDLKVPTNLHLMTKYRLGHGDWLIDEIRLSGDSLVIHEIAFSNGHTWTIECESIDYQWIPIDKSQFKSE